MSHDEVLRTYRDMILIVFLVFIEGIVLIDILHIGGGLVGRIVAFAAHVGVGRVTLWVIDTLVALQDRSLHGIIVTSAEIVVIVVGRVALDAVEDLG